ncbi:hypothetical protein M9Y10_013039 [Tritrichomonas musculus]|uniref:RRM domain-containing protein n=1 Tax=Tritrichomonas musculus TaxID=1915356 RepID=A0ABR2I6A7_9EUKA
MLPKHYRSNGFKIFLIRSVKLNEGTKINPTFAFYSCPVFTFNDDTYLCFYTKMPLLVDDVVAALKADCHVHVDPSQVMGTNFDESFGIKRTRGYRRRKKMLASGGNKKSLPRGGGKNIDFYEIEVKNKEKEEKAEEEEVIDDEHAMVYFYIWRISDSLYADFLKLVYGLGANRVKAEFNSFYCKVTCEERSWHSLIPLFRLFDVEIAFNLSEIPAVYVEDISPTISDDNVSKYFTKRSGGDSGFINFRLEKDLSGNHFGERVFSIEFEDMDKCNDFVKEYQDYNIQDSLINIKRMIDDDVMDECKRAEITIKGLEAQSITPIDRKEFRSDLENKYGPIYHLRIYYEGQDRDEKDQDDQNKKCCANVIFVDIKDGLRAVYDKTYENVVFTRTKLWMFNLLPETTENDIIQYFPDDCKPISATIYNEAENRCWWAVVQFNEKTIKDVQKAEDYLDQDDRESIGLLIPFGYIPYYGGNYAKRSKYTKMCVNYMKHNSIFIEKTENITVDQIVFLLESNELENVNFLYCFCPEKKETSEETNDKDKDDDDNDTEKNTKSKNAKGKRKKAHGKKPAKASSNTSTVKNDNPNDFEITVVSFRDQSMKAKAMRSLENESIEGRDIEVKEIEKAAMKKKIWFPRKGAPKTESDNK